MAIINKSNHKLRQRTAVETFLKMLQDLKSLEDLTTRLRLSSLPLKMSEEAIPLFNYTNHARNLHEDYQLHPCYTWRKVTKPIAKPHVDLLRISSKCEAEKIPERLNIVICLGRLFVRARSKSTRCLLRWTGYEIFVDNSLHLWMVFDKTSISNSDRDLHPLRCLLSNPLTLHQFESGEDNKDFVDIARLCHLYEIASFGGPSIEQVANTASFTSIRCETLQVDQIDRTDKLEFFRYRDEGDIGSPQDYWKALEFLEYRDEGVSVSPQDYWRAPKLRSGTPPSPHSP